MVASFKTFTVVARWAGLRWETYNKDIFEGNCSVLNICAEYKDTLFVCLSLNFPTGYFINFKQNGKINFITLRFSCYIYLGIFLFAELSELLAHSALFSLLIFIQY